MHLKYFKEINFPRFYCIYNNLDHQIVTKDRNKRKMITSEKLFDFL